MKVDGVAGPAARGARSGEARSARVFRTREETLARRHGTVLPYFRLEDKICRAFLELARDPAEFAGLKVLFPYVREMSLLGLPRRREDMARWMAFGFLAGHDLGRAHPELTDEVLPGREAGEARRRVGVIRQCWGEEVLGVRGLERSCARIVNAKWGAVAEGEVQAVIVEAVVKSLRGGFGAGTVCQSDPVLCDFVWDLPERVREWMPDLLWRFAVGSAVTALGRPVTALLEHPLLRMGRAFYPGRAAECDAVVGFLREQLRACEVKSELECPVSELDLLDWIDSGMAYGARLLREESERVSKVFREAQGPRLDDSVEVVKQVVAEAGGTQPGRLLGSMKAWHSAVYGWQEPGFYGESLARVVHFSDFAVWIPWVLTGLSGEGRR